MVTTDYVNGFQYENNVLQFFPHPEGYVKRNANNTYLYAYQYKDHLGNVRLSYADINKNGTIEPASEILEENNYYPFGLLHKGYNNIANSNRSEAAERYKFNGMEWQPELGLDLYDFGARNYDPAIGRWLNVDPLAEVSRRWTPYNYAYNNPIYFVDPDGMLSGSFNNGYYNIDIVQFAGSMESWAGGFWTEGSDGLQHNPNPPDGKKRALQGYSDGYGKGIFRDYTVNVKNSKYTAKDMFEMIKSNFSDFVEGQAYFENISSEKPMKVGDEISILGGPGFGKVNLREDVKQYAIQTNSRYADDKNVYTALINTGVTVTNITEGKNHYSMTFQTWKGHVEAGYITFNVTQGRNNNISLNISSMARNSNMATAFVYYYLGGRNVQTTIWRTFLNNFVKYSGGKETNRKIK